MRRGVGELPLRFLKCLFGNEVFLEQPLIPMVFGFGCLKRNFCRFQGGLGAFQRQFRLRKRNLRLPLVNLVLIERVPRRSDLRLRVGYPLLLVCNKGCQTRLCLRDRIFRLKEATRLLFFCDFDAEFRLFELRYTRLQVRLRLFSFF